MYNKMEGLTIFFVVIMVSIAEHYHVNDIIFPEIAALAFGAWVMEDRPWAGPVWTIWVSPTLGAITGVLVLSFMSNSITAMVVVALLFVFIELKLFRSYMSPSISAAILPIIIGAKGLVYPVSVCLLTGVVALLAYRNENKRLASGERPALAAPEKAPSHASPTSELFHYGKLLFFIVLLAALADKTDWLYIIAPPLLVVFVELTHPGSVLRKKSRKKLLLLLTACAVEGMLWVSIIVNLLSGPRWLAAGLSLATAISLARLFRLSSPPAFALSLLPVILPASALYSYPAHVFAGALCFILISEYCFSGTAKPVASA